MFGEKYKVKIYNNPLQAMDEIDGQEDIVFSDLSMPGLLGNKLLQQLRDKYSKQSNPYLKTALITSENIKDLGDTSGFVDGYLKKPTCKIEIEKIIKELLNKRF